MGTVLHHRIDRLTGQLPPPEEEEQEREELSTGFGLYFVSTQPASPSHPLPQQYQGQRLSRKRGISRDALWV